MSISDVIPSAQIAKPRTISYLSCLTYTLQHHLLPFGSSSCASFERPSTSSLAFTVSHFRLAPVEDLKEICGSLPHARMDVCLRRNISSKVFWPVADFLRRNRHTYLRCLDMIMEIISKRLNVTNNLALPLRRQMSRKQHKCHISHLAFALWQPLLALYLQRRIIPEQHLWRILDRPASCIHEFLQEYFAEDAVGFVSE